MSLRDGSKKMSKSDESDMSRINLTDDADAIANKIRRAKTDPHPLPDSKGGLKDRPEAENLLNIYAALADRTRDAVIAQFAGKQFSAFKNALADLTVAKLSPINAEMRRLLADPAEIDRVLKDGAAQGPRHRHADHGRSQEDGGFHNLKNVLVTGAAKRLGRAIALDLASAGWNVAIHYNGSSTEAEQVAAEIRGQGRQGHAGAGRFRRKRKSRRWCRPRPRRSGR